MVISASPANSGNGETFPLKRFEKFCSQLKIQSKDYGLTRFRMLGSQRYILDEICKALYEGASTLVILKARQLGASTFFIALDMFWAYEYKGLGGVFVTHTDNSREQFRNIITVYDAHLPKTHKIKPARHNRSMIIFKNGSQISYLVAGTREKSRGGLGRSGAFNYCHCTEVAFWGSDEDLKDFRATLSSAYPHRLQIWETTANGFNHFWDMWKQAKTSPAQRAIFVGWWLDERNGVGPDHSLYPVDMPQ